MSEALATLRAANVRRFLESIDSLSTSGGENGKPSQWQAVLDDGRVVALDEVGGDLNVVELRASWSGAEGAWSQFTQRHTSARAAHAEQVRLEKHDLGRVNRRIDDARLRLRAAELATGVTVLDRVDELRTLQDQIQAQEAELSTVDELVSRVSKKYGPDSTVVAIARQIIAAWRAEVGEQAAPTRERMTQLEGEIARQAEPLRRAVEDYLRVQRDAAAETVALQARIARSAAEGARYQLHLVTADGQTAAIPLNQIVRGYPANQLSTSGKWSVYFSRWHEFLFDEPREANSEGGVFPALFGTVAMTMIMSLVVVPFGVLAALYLREYAKGGAIVSAVRIAINNLAGVPSIVFGVFGLGFFCYLVGAFVDGGP
ncbi:MAG TPA: hypothetical protein PLV92_25545, partial [Pirellulaceae bacterium]|nr:hypothetical protein [Pirellulaceae bacterium]